MYVFPERPEGVLRLTLTLLDYWPINGFNLDDITVKTNDMMVEYKHVGTPH